MHEFWAQTKSFVLAIAVHALMAAVVVLGTMNWKPFKPPVLTGMTIEAVMVDTGKIRERREQASPEALFSLRWRGEPKLDGAAGRALDGAHPRKHADPDVAVLTGAHHDPTRWQHGDAQRQREAQPARGTLHAAAGWAAATGRSERRHRAAPRSAPGPRRVRRRPRYGSAARRPRRVQPRPCRRCPSRSPAVRPRTPPG